MPHSQSAIPESRQPIRGFPRGAARRLLFAAVIGLLPACNTTHNPAPALDTTPPPSARIHAAAPLAPQEFAQVFTTAAVAADHALASQAGLEVLKLGGNAVDAAVATSFALSVVRPYSCGIGGGGFMVIHLREHPRGPVTTALNYRETGPAAITPTFFEGDPDPDAATHGGKAVAVPGHVAGMFYALEKYGTLSREQVLAPAIRFAEEGFIVDAHYIESTREVIEWITAAPRRAERFPFLWDRFLFKGEVKIGDRIKLPEQARALRLLAQHGPDAFYKGEIGEALVRAVQADGGIITMADLAAYRVQEVAPLEITAANSPVRGRRILGMPPPSSGGIVLVQVLEMLEARPDLTAAAKKAGHNSALYIHLVAEASKHAFADRARWVGDPNFVDVPLKGLLSETYLADRAAKITDATLPHEAYGAIAPPPEDHGTSHLCVVDQWGNAVSCSETINLIFGSLLPVPEFGFCLNDEIDDFTTRSEQANAFGLVQSLGNRPEPGKRPLSSMTPTIVLEKDPAGGPDRAILLAGGSGGPRIISGTVQSSLNVLLFDMSAGDAIAAPRFHHQWSPNTLQLEHGLINTDVEAQLKARGHTTARHQPMGNIQLIRAHPAGGWQASADPRKGGIPAGY